jgi:hypothetical protein
MHTFAVVFMVLVILFIVGLFAYLFRGPGSNGYYQRGKKWL